MSYEILGESIKSATSIKIGDIFKVATNQTDQQGNPIYTYPYRYKENVTNPHYPSFWIKQISLNVTPKQTKVQGALNKDLERIQLDYLMNIQYRLAENTEQVTNLRQQLDAVGLKLLTEFTQINLEYPLCIKNARYEIVDGVLQFFYNVTLYATNKQVNEVEMDDLSLQADLEKEE